MSTAPAPISREAGDKTKGFRFQKLRAAVRLLQRISTHPNVQSYCAMEFIEDSALFCGEDSVSVEENKQYSSSLSFNSSAVKNSVVAFLDADAAFSYSKGLRFGFYASAAIAGERLSLEKVNEALPGRSETSFELLRKLVAGTLLSNDEVAVAKLLIEDEYRSQYESRAEGEENVPPFAAWTVSQFRTFLEKIDWTFGIQSNDDIEEEALELVRRCPFFDHRHEGLESFLLSGIADLLERRSHAKGAVERIVGTADIKNLFLEILAQRREDMPDPAHRDWNNEVVNDRRNLSEKVLAVAPTYPNQRLLRLARRIAVAKHERDVFGREYVSLLLRVLHACQDEFDMLASAASSSMSEAEVDLCIEVLVKASIDRMNILSSTWSYRIVNEQAIRGAVLTLFDECYLAFDNAAA